MISKYRNATRYNSEGENQIPWNPTKMIPKYRNLTWDNTEGENKISWNSAEMIRKVKIPLKWFWRLNINLVKSHRDDSEVQKLHPRWYWRWKSNLVKSRRDDSKGENSLKMILKVKHQSRQIPPRWFRRWKNFISWISTIRLICYLIRRVPRHFYVQVSRYQYIAKSEAISVAKR
jgi:hypothetical protein